MKIIRRIFNAICSNYLNIFEGFDPKEYSSNY
jgi:hypothetical protein